MSTRQKILVTGGAGMIGSNLVKRLVEIGHQVKVVDNLWRGKKEYLYSEDGKPVIDIENDFINIDLSIPNSLEPYLKDISYVFHLADIVAGVDYVFNHEGVVFRQNMLINSNVINAVKKHDLKGFVYVGTACSFPAEKQTGIDAPPLRENDQYPASPESAYGWSKLMGEYETFLLEKETGIPVSVLVLHNVYGIPCDYSVSTSQVIPSLVRKAVEYPETPFVVWGSGVQGRAFVHINDVVDALVSTKKYGLGRGIIQIGPDKCSSIKEVAETIVQISGKSIDIQYDSTKPEGDKGRCADYSKASRILQWSPKVPLEDGLKEIYNWIEAKTTKSSLR
jgi:nucleoside-diphosphate-sugar epimerase